MVDIFEEEKIADIERLLNREDEWYWSMGYLKHTTTGIFITMYSSTGFSVWLNENHELLNIPYSPFFHYHFTPYRKLFVLVEKLYNQRKKEYEYNQQRESMIALRKAITK